jgi:hypothetical protein
MIEAGVQIIIEKNCSDNQLFDFGDTFRGGIEG